MIYPVKKQFELDALLGAEGYKKKYHESITDNQSFWHEASNKILWKKAPSIIKNTSYDKDNLSVKWFEDGVLNVSESCIDRHAAEYPNKTAIIWEGDNPKDQLLISYQELLSQVCRLSNALRDMGVEKGDRVTIYMPMIPEAAYAMLACSRIGAVHSVVFGGFSAEALRGRIEDCESRFVITADQGVRGGKAIPLKENVDQAIDAMSSNEVKKVLVVQRTGNSIAWDATRDVWYHELVTKMSDTFAPEPMSAEDPLFILYTSGSTGKPKGVLHTTAGYLLYAAMTHRYVFDYHGDEIYWCTADVGWITGHSYIVYGPLANGATTLMFEGIPTYPNSSRFWNVIDKHQVNIFYTAPTALRALMREGNDFVHNHDRSSLKLLGTVGEPIKEPEWMWYYETIGEKNCPIVDTWWQTETGGILITPLPSVTQLKPGSATLPFFGISPVILDESGNEIKGNPAEGLLAIKNSWPGQMRTIYGDHQRFIDTYFSMFKGYYFTGDGAKRDTDGYYWITGRVDDVLNVSGHRLGTAEIEGAIGKHEDVAEAAVVGYPHDIKGQGIYAFVTLMAGKTETDEMMTEIKLKVRELIGPHACPDRIQFSSALPKTRSGKIMRRILRKIAEGDTQNMGDISTLADPSVVEKLISKSN